MNHSCFHQRMLLRSKVITPINVESVVKSILPGNSLADEQAYSKLDTKITGHWCIAAMDIIFYLPERKRERKLYKYDMVQ